MDCGYTREGNSGFRNSCMWLGFSGRGVRGKYYSGVDINFDSGGGELGKKNFQEPKVGLGIWMWIVLALILNIKYGKKVPPTKIMFTK